jgi:DNA-directed RNA polymerase subunit RPC12/RpoP
MSEVFGYDIEDGIICSKCGENEVEKEEAEAEGYPDGYTCLICGDTVGTENYNGEDEA